MLKKETRNKIMKNKLAYLMIIPGFLATLIFAYVPLQGWWMAFTNYKLGKPIWGAEFVGLENFKEFFRTWAKQ